MSETRTHEIVNVKGLHARASAKLVEVVEAHDARAEISHDGMSTSGDSIMGLLMLAAAKGCFIEVKTSGADALPLMKAITNLIDNKFDEGK